MAIMPRHCWWKMNQTKVPLRKYFLSTQTIQELDWDNKGQIAFYEIGFNLSKLKRKIVKKKVISLKVQGINTEIQTTVQR